MQLKDAGPVRVALSESSPVTYRVIVVGGVSGADKTQTLDQLVAQHGKLAAGELMLVVFAQDNYDVRFEMGSLFRSKGVSAEEILGLVHTQYQPKVRAGQPENGLVALIQAINKRMA